MSDGRVEYEIRSDDSNLDSDLKKAEDKVQKSAEKTAEKQKAIEEKSVESTQKSNDKKVESTEEANKKVVESTEKAQDKIINETEATAEKVHNSVENASKNVQKSNEDVKNKAVSVAAAVGKAFAAIVTAATAAGTAVVMSGVSAENSFAKVKTMLSGNDLNKYYDDLMAVSNETGASFESLSEAMYQALSAGVSQDKAVEFVKSSVSLSKGGFTEVATAIDVVTTAINAYGLAMEDAAHIQDVLITTQNKGKTTVDELASNMGKIIPTANSLNVSLDQLGAMYATVTANGVATAESTTYMNSMLNELASSSSTASKALAEAASGKTFKQLTDEGKTVAEILALIDANAKQSGKSMTDMFGSAEAAKAAQILVDKTASFNENLIAMKDSAGAAETAAATMMETLQEKMNQLVNRGKNMLTEIGNELMPIVSEAIDVINENLPNIEVMIKDLAPVLASLLEQLLSLITDILPELVSIIKPLLELVVQGFLPAVINLVKFILQFKEAILAAVVALVAYKSAVAISSLISALSKALQGASVAQYALNTAMSLNPFGVVAAAISALITLLGTFMATVQDGSDKIRSLSSDVAALADNSKKLVNDAKSVDSVISEYKKISESTSDAKTKSEELAKVQETLNSTYGKSAEKIDLVNGEYEEQIKLLQQLSEEERIRSLNQVQSDLEEARKKLDEAGDQQIRVNLEFDDNSVDYLNDVFKRLQAKYNTDTITAFDLSSIKKNGDLSVAELFFNSEDIDQQIEFLTELKEAILSTGEANGIMADSYDEVFDTLEILTDLKNNVITLEEAEKRLSEASSDSEESTDGLTDSLFTAASSADSFTSSAKDAAKTVSELTTEMDNLSAAFAEQRENGDLSIDTTLKLIDSGYSAILMIDAETGAVRINTEAYRELAKAKIEEKEATLRATRADVAAAYGNKIASAGMLQDDVKVAEAQEEYRKAVAEYDSQLAVLEQLKSGIGNVVTGSYSSSAPGGVKRDTSTSGNTTSGSPDKSSSTDKSTASSSSSGYSGSSGGNIISITSYIPTVWDSESETNKKLRRSNTLSHISKAGQLVSINGGAESNVSNTSSKAVGGSSSAYETTLADVVKAVNSLKKSQDEMKITVTSILQCDKRTLAKVTAEGINEITKATGKSPLQ